MWGYYAQPHSFVSSRDTKKGSMLRARVVNAGCLPYVHGPNKAPESFNFPKLVGLPALTPGERFFCRWESVRTEGGGREGPYLPGAKDPRSASPASWTKGCSPFPRAT